MIDRKDVISTLNSVAQSTITAFSENRTADFALNCDVLYKDPNLDEDNLKKQHPDLYDYMQFIVECWDVAIHGDTDDMSIDEYFLLLGRVVRNLERGNESILSKLKI